MSPTFRPIDGRSGPLLVSDSLKDTLAVLASSPGDALTWNKNRVKGSTLVKDHLLF